MIKQIQEFIYRGRQPNGYTVKEIRLDEDRGWMLAEEIANATYFGSPFAIFEGMQSTGAQLFGVRVNIIPNDSTLGATAA